MYGRLVLSQRGPWETRFRQLEAFVEENGRLPRLRGAACDRAEIVLGNWLRTQGSRVRLQQMPAHRLQRLLNARSDLVRRRAEGWMAGGLVGRFQQKCRELKEYIEMNGKLPTRTRTKRNWRNSSSNQLAKWLADLRKNGIHAMPERRKMLEEVHPLVKELLQKLGRQPSQRFVLGTLGKTVGESPPHRGEAQAAPENEELEKAEYAVALSATPTTRRFAA